MSGRFPVGKPKVPAWSLPVMALTVALLVHALWLVLPQPKVKALDRGNEIKLFAYPNLDTQVWSPTLFSLPSTLGFSGAVRQRTSNVLPPLKSPVLLHAPTPLDFDSLFESPGLDLPLSHASELPISVHVSPEKAEEVPVSYEWRFDILDGERLRYDLIRLPSAPENGGSFVIVGSMSFDASGQVSSLVLDPPALPQSMRRSVFRSLRRIRRLNGEGETRIRFRFAYLPVESGI